MKTKTRIILLIAAATLWGNNLFGQQAKLNAGKFSVMSGLTQPLLLGGVNIAGTYMTNRLYLEYSHGMFLKLHNLGGIGMTAPEREAFATLYVPYSTGAGVGYRITNGLNVFWEFKVHRFEAAVKGTNQTLGYNTFEMGPAVSYRFFFNKAQSFFIEPVARYWFTTAAFGNTDLNGITLPIRQADNSIYSHRVHQFGFFVNASIGYVFK